MVFPFFVDGSVQVSPLATGLDVGLVNPPARPAQPASLSAKPLFRSPVHRSGHSGRSFNGSYDRIWVTGSQAAIRSTSVTSTPLQNSMLWMTLGNCLPPVSCRQVFEAAIASLKTLASAVVWTSDPLVRTVRWQTVANTLSTGFVVLRCRQCSAGKS